MKKNAQQIVIHSLYRNTYQKVFYIIVINILGYTTKISNNKHLFKRIDKNLFVILQKNEQNMFRLLKIIKNYEGGNLAASKIRNLECPSYEICLIDYGCGKFNRKIHIMEQYP